MRHRGSDSQTQRPLPPEWLPPDEDLEINTGSVRGGNAAVPSAYPAPVHYTSASYAPPRGGSYGQHAVYRSDVQHGVIDSPTFLPQHQIESPTYLPNLQAPISRSQSSASATPPRARVRTPEPQPRARTPEPRPRARTPEPQPRVTPAPLPQAKVVQRSASHHSASQKSAPKAPPVQAPAPLPPPAPAANPAEAAAPQINLGGIDPMMMPIPPELAPPIYSWVRRLALQANLTAADKLLRDALADLTQSLSVAIFYPGADGLFSLGVDEEMPRDPAPLIAVAQARQALIATHTALVPVTTSTETVAVILLQRNPHQQGYSPIEQISMLGLARESAAILHHLTVQHIQHASEVKADQGSLYRGEALEAHRNRGNEGVLANLTPGWVRKTYPLLVGTLIISMAFAIVIHVGTYSAGPALILFDGQKITAPAMGTVADVLVAPGEKVKAGMPIIRMMAIDEEAELAQAETELNDALTQYMYDPQDDKQKSILANAVSRRQHAFAKLDARTIRAKQDGNVSDIHINRGQLLQPGDYIVTLVDDKTLPEVTAFMPGKDRPRIHVGMEIQIELQGYTKTREIAIITSVGRELMGANAAAKYVGAQIADSLQLTGSIVLVTAKLKSRTFKTEHNTYNYHNGMQAKTEIKIQSKPFLVTLLPALEKYLPD